MAERREQILFRCLQRPDGGMLSSSWSNIKGDRQRDGSSERKRIKSEGGICPETRWTVTSHHRQPNRGCPLQTGEVRREMLRKEVWEEYRGRRAP